jgi:folate-dependent phosphoribosylglycinamide formyltransferase PurN
LEGQGASSAKPPRVALCHLESLVGLPALNALFAELGDQIELVILSDRFGGKHGGSLRQLLRGIRRSGFRMTFWLGFDIVAAQSVWRVARVVGWLTGRAPTLRTVRDLAAQHNTTIIQTAEVNSDDTIGVVERLGIDIVVVMNFDQILRNDFIKSARLAVINVHPSLLPSFRGPCPVLWALLEARREIGVTIHFIENAEIDAGPIVMQRAMELHGEQSVGELTSALFLAGVQSIKRVTERLAKEGNTCWGRAGEGEYKGFPSRAQMAAASRRIRLWRMAHLSSLVGAAVGLCSL